MTKGRTKINKSKDSDSRVQQQIQGGFSTKVDPHAPQNDTVGRNVKDTHELRNKILEDYFIFGKSRHGVE